MGNSGGLIQLNTKSIGYFYKDLKDGFAMFMNSYRTINKWVRTNGSGLLSETGAYTLKQLIKSTIDQDDNAVPTNWEPPSIEQIMFKEQYGRFVTPWKMAGGVYSNIVATRRSGKWVVGIDRRATVKKIGFSTLAKHPLKKGKSVRVETYAEMIEFGDSTANIPARPLFSTVATNFIATKIPELVDLFTKSLGRSANDYKLTPTGSKYSTGNVSDVVSEFSMNPNKDFSDSIVSDAKIQASVGNICSNARRQTSKIDKQDKQEYLNFIKKNKVNLEELSPEIRKVIGL